jgi:arylsulfatase A-like enzyme
MICNGNMPDGLTRRQFVQRGALAAAGTAMAGAEGAAAKGKRPNLLFVFSDEHSWDMLGCYGNEQIISPHLDRFASQGIRFNHCISNSPVCTPYRGMLLSGLHPLYHGAMVNDYQMLPGNGDYFGEVLRDAGYRMGYVGKWHLYGGDRNRPIPAGPLRYGFDGTFLTNNCTTDYRPGRCYYWNDDCEKVHFQEWEVFGQTRQALEFLDDCSEDEPFALFVSWHPPHDNGKTKDKKIWRYETIPELMGLYDEDRIQYRPNFDSEVHDKRSYHGHMAMISGVDMAFGWLMDKLKEKGLDENTVVVFTADHGDLLGSNGRPWPKAFPEDGSIRVPFLLRWPERLPAGKTSDLLVGSIDLMPTLLGMMGLNVPKTCQGQDLAEHILAGRDDAVSSVPLFLIPGNWRGVYTRRYTYSTSNAPTGHYRETFCRLYDKQGDPLEMRNLYDDPAHKALQQEMHRLTEEWMATFNDPFLTVQQIASVCFPGGKPPNHKRGQDGALLGRPIDLIRNLPKPAE